MTNLDKLITKGKEISDAGLHAPKRSKGVVSVVSDVSDDEPQVTRPSRIQHSDPDDVVSVVTEHPLAGMITAEWLDQQHFPATTYAVPGIIPEGFGLLVGPPKSGKSWFVANIGLAVATGGRAIGSLPVEQRPVLYLALEDGHRRLQGRLRRIMAGEKLPKDLHIINKAKPYEVPIIITAFLEMYSDRAPLVILDTLGKVKPPQRPGSDSYSVDYAIGSSLKDMVDAVNGSTLLVVHHTRKSESGDFVDSVSGTNGIAGSADFIIVLARKRMSDEAILSVTGRDVSENEYALTTDNGLWSLDGEDLVSASSAVQKRRDTNALGDHTIEILNFVNSRAQTTPAEVTKKFGIKPNQAAVCLGRLLDAGRITKISRGVYGPALHQPTLTD